MIVAGVLFLAAALLSGCGGDGATTVTAAGGSTKPVVLTAAERAGESCAPASEHPSEFVLACGMGYELAQLEWHHWGEPVSYAEGSAKVSDCEPNCEAGKIKTVRIQLIASLIATCTNGQRRYTKLNWSFPGGWPAPPEHEGFNDEVRTPCPAA
jgi:hypothetical protein